MHFDGTSEDVQIERLGVLTREFHVRLRHEQGYNIVAVHVAVQRNVQSAFGPLKKRAFLVNVTVLSHILTKQAVYVLLRYIEYPLSPFSYVLRGYVSYRK